MDNNSFKISYTPIPRSAYLGKENPYPQSRVMDVMSAIEGSQAKYQILSLTSAYQGEGAAEIAFELASKLSASGKRVLIVDSEATDMGVYREFRYRMVNSINTFLQNPSSENHTVLQVENTNIFYSCFCKSSVDKGVAYHSERLSAFFKSLRNAFDYVLVITEVSSGLSIAHSTQISDASIVIVEAERTRRPVVAQLIENIKLSGGNILGLVLNKRPLYIPPAIYSLFYR